MHVSDGNFFSAFTGCYIHVGVAYEGIQNVFNPLYACVLISIHLDLYLLTALFLRLKATGFLLLLVLEPQVMAQNIWGFNL